VSNDVRPGETLGLVGESGSGKTVTALAILGLTRLSGGRVMSGLAKFEGTELTTLPERQLRTIRGKRIGMIFQQPIRSLNPAFTVGEHIAETVRRHDDVNRSDAWARAVRMLERVGIANAAQRAKQYPHQFSGGMRQRIMIAMAIALDPAVLIADEPTTALDVTVQAQVLNLMREIQAETNIAILFISHDLGVIAEMCERVVVMYAGQAVDAASSEKLFVTPRHPYTEGLLGAIPTPERGRDLVSIPGNVPSPGRWPHGCRFAPRCPYVVAGRCDVEDPPLVATDGGHEFVRCVRAEELDLQGIILPGVGAA
ncbi:MAG TPA: ABC transporter ATP-binding protein, partial [Acidimicrobiales bacterium]|nr:ABC transporter ATP-binding protein [Acidimicrobiales bacterium]